MMEDKIMKKSGIFKQLNNLMHSKKVVAIGTIIYIKNKFPFIMNKL